MFHAIPLIMAHNRHNDSILYRAARGTRTKSLINKKCTKRNMSKENRKIRLCFNGVFTTVHANLFTRQCLLSGYFLYFFPRRFKIKLQKRLLYVVLISRMCYYNLEKPHFCEYNIIAISIYSKILLNRKTIEAE